MNQNLLWMFLHADHHAVATGAPLLIGLLASMLHVISGPDHLAAVTPLAIENKLKAWFIGLGWGIGHTSGMLLIGVLFIYFKEFLPIDSISAYSELMVGFILILIGIWALWRIFGRKYKHTHQHPHSHHTPTGEIITHVHPHDHPQMNVHEHKHIIPLKQSFISAILIGTLHGFAGVSHLIGMLPTLAFPSMADSVSYLIGFGVGTVVAMVAFSFLLGFVSYKSDDKAKPFLFKSIQIVGASASLIVGFYWILMSI